MKIQFLKKNIEEIVRQINLCIASRHLENNSSELERNYKIVFSSSYYGFFSSKNMFIKPEFSYKDFHVYKTSIQEVFCSKKVSEQIIKYENGKVISDKVTEKEMKDETPISFDGELHFHFSTNKDVIFDFTEDGSKPEYCYANFNSIIKRAFEDFGTIYVNDIPFVLSYQKDSDSGYVLRMSYIEDKRLYKDLTSKILTGSHRRTKIKVDDLQHKIDAISSFITEVESSILSTLSESKIISLAEMMDYIENYHSVSFDDDVYLQRAYEIFTLLSYFKLKTFEFSI